MQIFRYFPGHHLLSESGSQNDHQYCYTTVASAVRLFFAFTITYIKYVTILVLGCLIILAILRIIEWSPFDPTSKLPHSYLRPATQRSACSFYGHETYLHQASPCHSETISHLTSPGQFQTNAWSPHSTSGTASSQATQPCAMHSRCRHASVLSSTTPIGEICATSYC